jgi:hypothetical protein
MIPLGCRDCCDAGAASRSQGAGQTDYLREHRYLHHRESAAVSLAGEVNASVVMRISNFPLKVVIEKASEAYGSVCGLVIVPFQQAALTIIIVWF